MTFRFINSSEKKKILEEIKNLYGISELNYLLMEAGKKRIRAFSGSLTKEEISELNKFARIENTGMYLASQKDAEIRLNFDAVSLFREQITKNIIEINDEQFQKWIRGQDLELATQRGTIIIKYKDDLIGIGKSNGERIFNYIPKERKLKTQIPK